MRTAAKRSLRRGLSRYGSIRLQNALCVTAAVAFAVSVPVYAATAGQPEDTILKAMQTELDREKAELVDSGDAAALLHRIPAGRLLDL